MEPYQYTQVESRLSNLLAARRLRFPYVDSLTGNFRWKRFPWVILNTLASCLNFPVLFYMSFYVLAIYPGLNVKPLDMLSVVFFTAAFSILFDVFIGYFYDKLIKPLKHGSSYDGIKNLVSIVGTIGLVITLAFFFRGNTNPAEATTQFRVTLLLSLFFLTLANCTNVKNSANYSPSQEDRRLLHHSEYFIKGLVIWIYVAFPLWVRFGSNDCSCGDICKGSPDINACRTCLDKCDAVTDVDYFRVNSIVWTCIFGLANILVQFLVKTRNDEDREDISTTFNRRLVEIWTNKFLIKTLLVTILEFTIFFGFAIWSYYYFTNEVTISEVCIDRFGSWSYLCTRSFWLRLTVFFIALLSGISLFISYKKSYLLTVSIASSCATVIAAIFIITIPNSQTTMFCFAALIIAGFYSTFALTKLVFSNAVFYDEYKSGSAQSNLPSSLFLLSMKLGFLFALGLHLTFIDSEGLKKDGKNNNNEGFGFFIILASCFCLALKFWINKYNLAAFDKIQIAIERNLNLQRDDITFYDPIAKEPVKYPVTSFNTVEKKLIRLMYNLTPKDMLRVVNGKQEKVKANGMQKAVFYLIVAVVLTIIITILGSHFNDAWGWFLLIGLLAIPVSLLGALFNYNVWASANALEASKYKAVDRTLLLRFAYLLDRDKDEKP